MLALDDGELVDYKPVIRVGIAEVHQLRVIAGDAAVGPSVLDFHSLPEHPVKDAIRLRERGRSYPKYLAQRLLSCVFWNGRIQAPDGFPKTTDEHHISE